MAAGDTFRAAAGDQLEIWAERTGCEIVRAEGDVTKASSGKKIEGLYMMWHVLMKLDLVELLADDLKVLSG